jgi:hypothetical protein
MSKEPSNYLDPLSLVVIILTLVLFVIALFVKGFGHELLQECGVFLVSVKLIMMSHKNGASAQRAEERLAKIQDLLQGSPPALLNLHNAFQDHARKNGAIPKVTDATSDRPTSNLYALVLHFLVC